ncbi:hypothetical protein B0H10DRAFT_2224725 [Mycena sp. CBHHK59/15]|nr:hypothetical protein B0H10DRAFT_2224725 [Mycena sp. CBHHK59/15]
MAVQAANPANGPVAANPKANPGLLDSGNAGWTCPDIKRLLDFLVEHQAEAGDGENFKPKTFRTAAVDVNLICTKGGPKSYKLCQQKYTGVRKEWLIVSNIKDTSGYPWDDEKG